MKKDECDGKAVFTRWASAERAAGKIARREGEPMHVYTCPHCHRFHVGGGIETKASRCA